MRSDAPVARLLRRTLAACALAALALTGSASSASAADAVAVVPTTRLYTPDGTLAGFRSNEPSLYFLVASGWTLAERDGAPAAYLAPVTDAGTTAYDLRLTLRPDYAKDAPLVASVRKADPQALFFPLPAAIRDVTLYLPGALGGIQATLTPDDGVSTSLALYYRLRFGAAQLSALRTLAHGGVTLQGTVTYDYEEDGTTHTTAAPLTIQIPPSDLDPTQPVPVPDATRWLDDLLVTTELDVPHALDGKYPLGAGIAVTLANSRVRGHVVPGAYRLTDASPRLLLAATRPTDFQGEITFDVPELRLAVRVQYDAALDVSLDLSTMEVAIDRFVVTGATVQNVASPFYTQLLKNLTAQKSFTSAVSSRLSAELQRRILTQTLFGLESVL